MTFIGLDTSVKVEERHRMGTRPKRIDWSAQPLGFYSSRWIAMQAGTSVQAVRAAMRHRGIAEPDPFLARDPLPPFRSVRPVRSIPLALAMARDLFVQTGRWAAWSEPSGREVLASMALLSVVRWTTGARGSWTYRIKHMVEDWSQNCDRSWPSYCPESAAVVAAFALGIKIGQDFHLGVHGRDINALLARIRR